MWLKSYFADYFLSMSDVRFDLKTNTVEYLNNAAEPWKVTLVDTGEKTLTGGRLRRVKDYLGDETFCMTYGDGVTNLDIPKVIEFHREHKGLATLSPMQPPGRYGAFTLHKDQKRIEHFAEKPIGDGAWVNGGFFVLEPKVIDYISGDLITWEQEPMQNSLERAIFSLSHITVSGTRWTAFATRWYWRECGQMVLRGKFGTTPRRSWRNRRRCYTTVIVSASNDDLRLRCDWRRHRRTRGCDALGKQYPGARMS